MKHFFHFLLLAMFAAASLVLSACGDDKKADPTPTTGTLDGQITPAGSITTVTVVAGGGQTTTATPTAAGAYSFTDLAAGTYTLSFAPATGYTAPANQTVTIAAGGTTTATPVTVAASSSGSATMTYSVNGSATTANLITGNLIAGSLIIQSSANSGARAISLSLDGVNGAPVALTLGPGKTSEIIYNEVASTNILQWSTSTTAGSGTVTITSVSANPRRVSGTFNCVAQPDGSGTTGTKTITAGTFANVAY